VTQIGQLGGRSRGEGGGQTNRGLGDREITTVVA
jgi:hypothetical protein